MFEPTRESLVRSIVEYLLCFPSLILSLAPREVTPQMGYRGPLSPYVCLRRLATLTKDF